VSWLSEAERDEVMDLLRDAEKDLGVSGIVPPKPTDTNVAPSVAPPVEVPGPVATPAPVPGFVPPVSPEVATAQPETANAFSGTAAGTVAPPDAGT